MTSCCQYRIRQFVKSCYLLRYNDLNHIAIKIKHKQCNGLVFDASSHSGGPPFDKVRSLDPPAGATQ